jgi:prepilin-type N-terminal cleavage/methylation domain-containing protein
MERVEDAGGFTLIEVMIAIVVLTVGVMSMLGVMAMGVQTVGASSNMLIAREKAREAVESVHSARDTGELAWGRVRNVSEGGVFLNGMQDMKLPGVDGLVNTADDGAIEVVKSPGPDGVLGNGDDVSTPLKATEFQREVLITTLNRDSTLIVNPNLRQITVRVRYRVLNAWRTYTLTTFVSAYS